MLFRYTIRELQVACGQVIEVVVFFGPLNEGIRKDFL